MRSNRTIIRCLKCFIAMIKLHLPQIQGATSTTEPFPLFGSMRFLKVVCVQLRVFVHLSFVCSHFRFPQLLNKSESNLEGWFLRTLNPRTKKIAKKNLSHSVYKCYCFYRIGSRVQFLHLDSYFLPANLLLMEEIFFLYRQHHERKTPTQISGLTAQ